MNCAELLEKIYANPAILFDYLHEDFTVHAPGNNKIAGVHNGPDGFRAHMALMAELSNNTFSLEPQGTIVGDEHFGLAVSRATGQRDGKTLDTLAFGLWGFKDGLLTDHWERVGDPQQWDHFWS
jgi:hypothetical protein